MDDNVDCRLSALASGLDRLSDNKERELQAANQTRDIILTLSNKAQVSLQTRMYLSLGSFWCIILNIFCSLLSTATNDV